jgi:hypothetical protein
MDMGTHWVIWFMCVWCVFCAGSVTKGQELQVSFHVKNHVEETRAGVGVSKVWNEVHRWKMAVSNCSDKTVLSAWAFTFKRDGERSTALEEMFLAASTELQAGSPLVVEFHTNGIVKLVSPVKQQFESIAECTKALKRSSAAGRVEMAAYSGFSLLERLPVFPKSMLDGLELGERLHTINKGIATNAVESSTDRPYEYVCVEKEPMRSVLMSNSHKLISPSGLLTWASRACYDRAIGMVTFIEEHVWTDVRAGRRGDERRSMRSEQLRLEPVR